MLDFTFSLLSQSLMAQQAVNDLIKTALGDLGDFFFFSFSLVNRVVSIVLFSPFRHCDVVMLGHKKNISTEFNQDVMLQSHKA